MSVLRFLVGLFFRRVEVVGWENVPPSGGGILISWHPNGLIDPGLILTHFPRKVFFGARHGLFKWPGLGALMRAIGTVPIYLRRDLPRDADEQTRRAANANSLETLARGVAGGSFAALFPEGASHDQPHLLDFRSGAARLFYRAWGLTPKDAPRPVVIPVGLHYDSKAIFGSNALVEFHPPLEFPPELLRPPVSEEELRSRSETMTEEFERALREVVHATESWQLNHLMHRARKLVRAERAQRAGAALERPEMTERVIGFARLWKGYYERTRSHPEATARLLERIRNYDEDLQALGVEDHELDHAGLRSPWRALSLVLQFLFIYLVLPPLFLVGWLVNLPTATLLLGVAKASAAKVKDEASVKLLLGVVAFPLTWLVVAVSVGLGQAGLHRLFPEVPEAPILTGAVAFALCAVGAVVSLQYQRRAREVVRSLRVRFARSQSTATIRRLQAERSAIFDAVMKLADGLALPGKVAADGRVLPDSGEPD